MSRRRRPTAARLSADWRAAPDARSGDGSSAIMHVHCAFGGSYRRNLRIYTAILIYVALLYYTYLHGNK